MGKQPGTQAIRNLVFNDLHAQHIKALRENNMILAYEILGKIHRLSYNLEVEELIKKIPDGRKERNYIYPGISKSIPDIIIAGHKMNQYVHGSFQGY